MSPKIAIIGRPNVGKSTLFNRITKTKNAIVDDFSGITRDRKYGKVIWEDVEFTLIDTGGFLSGNEDGFSKSIHQQVSYAIEEAEIILLVFDGKKGVSPFDKNILTLLYDFKKPIFYLANKIDSPEQENLMYDFYSLGIEEIFPVSSEHGFGISDFLDILILKIPQLPKKDNDQENLIKIAVIGKPNVGKSSFINKVLGKERLIVSPIAGTTRDSNDSKCKINNKEYILIDTAGLRRKSKTKEKIEKISIVKALNALDRCDIALIFIDAIEGLTDQDVSIAGYAYKRGCGCVFVFNKWDAVEEKNIKKHIEKIEYDAKYLSYAPVVSISAITGQRIYRLFNIIDEVYKQYSFRVGTGQINRIIERATFQNPPPMHQKKRLKIYYATQVAIKPPTFVFFVNYPKGVHFSYKRFLINQIRENTILKKIPIKILFKLRTGKIDFKELKGKRGKDKR